jgi:hypothetical protein
VESIRVRESEVENYLKKLKKSSEETNPGALVAVAVISLAVLIAGPLITLEMVPVVISIAVITVVSVVVFTVVTVVTVVVISVAHAKYVFYAVFYSLYKFCTTIHVWFCNALINCMSS